MKSNGESTRNLHVRVSDEMYQSLEKLSEKSGKPIAWCVRALIFDTLNAYEDHAVYVNKRQKNEVVKVVNGLEREMSEVAGQLRRLGNNVNQITKNSNTAMKYFRKSGGVPSDLPLVVLTDEQVQRLVDAYDEAAENIRESYKNIGVKLWLFS